MNATQTSHRNHRAYRPDPLDSGLHVQFFSEAVQCEAESKEQGRPIFKDFEFVEIRVPGDAMTLIKTFVGQEHRDRFPDEYDMFKRNETAAVTGTPLEHWPAVTKSQVAAMKHTGIVTVEDLAHLSDENLQKVMNGHDLRAKAKAFLNSAQDNALVEKQASEIAELRAMIEAIQHKEVAPSPEEAVKKSK